MADGGSDSSASGNDREARQKKEPLFTPHSPRQQQLGSKPVVPKKPMTPRFNKLKDNLRGNNSINAQGPDADSIASTDQGYQSVSGGTTGQDLKDQLKCGPQSTINQDQISFISSASKTINREKKNDNITIEQQPQQTPAFVIQRDSDTLEYGGSDYVRVYPGDNNENQWTSGSSSDEDDVHVNVPLTANVQNLHLHIHLSFNSSKQNSSRRRKESKQLNMQPVSEIHTKTHSMERGAYSYAEHTKRLPKSDVSTPEECPPLPPKKPIIPPKTFRIKTRSESTEYLTARSDSQTDMSEDEYETYDEQQVTQNKNKRQNEKVYDEINPIENVKYYGSSKDLSESDRSGKALQILGTSNQSWLFHHSEYTNAMDKIKTDQEGSFVVIEQDSCIMPYTPYTVMVVHNGQLIKIPVVKNKSKQGKCRYSLAGIGSPKAVNMNCYSVYESLVIKSIQELVSFFRRHELPRMKITLKPPD